jgi:hypothetical protein
MIALMMVGLADAGDWRWAGGGEINASSHGILDIGWREGPWSVQLLTDTIDVRRQQELSRGKRWGAARLEIGSAGLMSTPWTDGAPDPTAGMLASYGGVEGGWQRYLRGGLYAGVEGFARAYWFWALPQSAGVLDPQPLLMGQGVLGLWRQAVQVRLAAGGHVDPAGDGLAPHLTVQGRYLPAGPLAPWLEVYAGIAEGQGPLSTTRLGGLNPYVVPLAGAGWAEWWVEDYAAVRLGGRLQGERGSIGPALDAAVFDTRSAVGLGLHGTLRLKALTLDAALGHAPWIPRQEGVGRWSALVLLGRGWG